MENQVTWVVLGDGTYIKILVNAGSGPGLAPLRTGDFEHSSDLTYAMVTSHRHTPEKRDYYQLIAAFLTQQAEENAYQQLVLVAPDDILVKIKQVLPDRVSSLVIAELAEDLLAKPDKLIEQLIETYPQAGVGPR